jgi:MinD superfamily P-loop ATPase
MLASGSPDRFPRVDDDRCRVCERCAAKSACRTKALMIVDPGEPPYVDGSRCQGCRVCVPACLFGAVVI